VHEYYGPPASQAPLPPAADGSESGAAGSKRAAADGPFAALSPPAASGVVYGAWGVALFFMFLGSGNAFTTREPPALNLLLVLVARAALGAATAVLLLAALAGRAPLLARVLDSPFWRPFARLSYSAYLLQFNAILPIGYNLFPLHGVENELVAIAAYLLFFAIATAATFTLSLLLYVLVEKPVLNFRR
jgi:peptidoglycan/LPS O-acetylase OafA/YrhL